MKYLELAGWIREIFGIKGIAEDSTLCFVYLLCLIRAGVMTMSEAEALLQSDPTMREFEAIASRAWGDWPEDGEG
jgi:hypothetical protein